MYELVINRTGDLKCWMGCGLMDYRAAVKEGAKVLAENPNALVILKPHK